MAGTTHYSYYFKSYSGTEWIVLIKDSTYVGVTETALIPDNNGFNISWEGASDVTYQPIISSTFTAGVYRNTNSLALLNAIITGVENQFYVIVYKSGIRQWLGYILQDSLTKPDAANLTDKIMFTATDGFGMLKDIPYTGFDINNLTKIAMVDWVKSIMQKMPANEVSGEYTYTIASDWYEDSMSTAVTFDSFSQVLINESVFISVDEYGVATGISYYDMLTAVLTSFNLQISQWNGVYLIIQQNSYELTTIKYWKYRIAGTSTRGDLSLQMAAPTRFAGGTFGYILPVKECSAEYDYRHTIFDNNLLPDISHERVEYSLGYFLTDTVFSVDGNMNTTINMSVAGEDFISIAHRITIKCGSYYLKYVVGVLGPYYEWTLTASYFDITVDYPVFNGAGTSSVLLENPISLYIPSTPVDGAVTFQFDLSSVGSQNAITYSDDNSVLVVKTIATAANPAMEGSELHKATVSNSAKAVLELDNSILGDGPYMYSAGSLFVDIVSPTQSALWSILSNYGTANKWSLNTLRCMEMLALRRNTVNTFRSSWNGIPDIHKAIVFDSKTWVWTSMSFDCNAEEYSGSLIAIVLDRTGLTPATPIFKTDKSGLKSANSAISRFGDTSNYSEFEPDGTLVMYGNATVFDDLTGDITRTKTVGTRVTLNDTENSIDYTSACTLTDYLFLNYQMSHKWKAGSSIYPHIHFYQASSAIPNFLLEYRWQRNGGTKTTSWTRLKCNTPAFTYVSGTLNQLVYSAAIAAPTGYSISDIIQIRVIRDTANTSTLFTGTDTYNGNASVISVDIHYEIDTLGSRTEIEK